MSNAFFDMAEEISQRSIRKSETGDPRMFGVIIGEVVDNYSPLFPGRVCVSVHVRDENRNVLQWARVVQPSSGSEWGHYFLPEVGDEVLVIFDQGVIDKPYIIGAIPKDKDKFLKGKNFGANASNVYKKIQTKHGSTILFTDGSKATASAQSSEGAANEDGSNDKISIFTPEKAHEVTLDNEAHKITIKDKDNNAAIEMSTMTGKIEIKAANKLEIKVGSTITVTMNGTTGGINVRASNITMESIGKMNLKGGGNATLTGATVSVDAQANLKMNSAGMVKVAGNVIQLG